MIRPDVTIHLQPTKDNKGDRETDLDGLAVFVASHNRILTRAVASIEFEMRPSLDKPGPSTSMQSAKRTSLTRLRVLMALCFAGSWSAIAHQFPSIIDQPQSQTVLNGADVAFTVAAKGKKPLRYQWRFNAAPIPGETNHILAVSNAQCSNAGSYSVVVTNDAGSVTSADAILTVIDTVPPTIMCPPIIQVQSFSDIPPPDPGSVTTSDACSGVTVAFGGDTLITNNLDISVSRLWQATDSSGNSTQCAQIIAVNSNCIPPRVISFQLRRETEQFGFLATADIVATGAAPFSYYVCLGNFCTNFVSFSPVVRVGPLLEPFADFGPVQGVIVSNRCGSAGEIVAGISPIGLVRGFPALDTSPVQGFAGPVLTTPCGVLGASSTWVNVRAGDEGTAVVSTEGSSYDTILGVYTGQVSDPLDLHFVACNDDINPLTKQSRVQFHAQTNFPYYLVIGGVSTGGTFRLSYGIEPQLSIRAFASGGPFEIRSSPAVPLTYTLQASTNLLNWTNLLTTNFARLAAEVGTNRLTNTILYFRDTTSAPLPRRFYRLVHTP